MTQPEGVAPGAAEAEPWREPVRGGPADPLVLSLSGHDQLLALRDGRVRLPSNARLTGRRLTAVGEREVTYAMPLSPWLQGPKGTIHPGVLVLLGDSALTSAVVTALPPGVIFTTAELSMTYLGEMPRPGGSLLAHARVLHTDDRHGLAVADLVGPGGELLGFGTSRVFLQPPIDLSDMPAPPPPPPEPEWGSPDPWERELEEEAHAAGPPPPHGLEVLLETAAGGRPRSPIDRLFGITVRGVEKGAITFEMPASEWLTNELGMVGGGTLGLVAESATSAAGQTVARPGSPYRALDVKINFLQPVPPDGSPIVATGRAVHRGRLVVATTEVTHQGQLVALATGSTVLGS